MNKIEKSDNDTYKFIKKLGAGSYGEVYLAKNNAGNLVAIKTYIMGDAALRDMMKEKDCLERIKNQCKEYAVCIIDQYSIAGKQRLVMDYIEGSNMTKLMESLSRTERRSKYKYKALNELATGLYKIHQAGTTHQDIKEENIMYDRANDRFKFIDWGGCCGEYFFVNCGFPGTFYTIPPELYRKFDRTSTAYAQKNWQYFVTSNNTKEQAYNSAYIHKALEISLKQTVEEQKAHDVWSLGISLFRFLTSKPYVVNIKGVARQTFEYPDYYKAKPLQIQRMVTSTSLPDSIKSTLLEFLDPNPSRRVRKFEEFAKSFVAPAVAAPTAAPTISSTILSKPEIVETKDVSYRVVSPEIVEQYKLSGISGEIPQSIYISENIEDRILKPSSPEFVENIEARLYTKPEYIEDINIDQIRAEKACKNLDVINNRVYVFNDSGKDFCVYLKDIKCNENYAFDSIDNTFINPFTGNRIILAESTALELVGIFCAMEIDRVEKVDTLDTPDEIISTNNFKDVTMKDVFEKNVNSTKTPKFSTITAGFVDASGEPLSDALLIPLLTNKNMSTFDIKNLVKAFPKLSEKLNHPRYQKIIREKERSEISDLVDFLNKNTFYRITEKNLSSIYMLDLNFKNLTKIPEFLQHLKNLKNLDLSDNQITKLENLDIDSLEKLTISNNPVAENYSEIQEYKNSHENVEVNAKPVIPEFETESKSELATELEFEI